MASWRNMVVFWLMACIPLRIRSWRPRSIGSRDHAHDQSAFRKTSGEIGGVAQIAGRVVHARRIVDFGREADDRAGHVDVRWRLNGNGHVGRYGANSILGYRESHT